MADTEISDTLAEELDYEHDMEAAETSDLAEAAAENGAEDNKVRTSWRIPRSSIIKIISFKPRLQKTKNR